MRVLAAAIAILALAGAGRARADGWGVEGRGPAGHLAGERVVKIGAAFERGAQWRFAGLDGSGAVALLAPVVVRPAGLVDHISDNVAIAGDVVVAREEGRGVFIVRGDGTVVSGPSTGGPALLRAVRAGPNAVVFWRLDATRTEVEAIDVASGASRWRRAGPTWTHLTELVTDGTNVAVQSNIDVVVLAAATGAAVRSLSLAWAARTSPGAPPIALAPGRLLVGAGSGLHVVDLGTGARTLLAHGLAPLDPVFLAADAAGAFLTLGRDLVAFDLARGARAWTATIPYPTHLSVGPTHLGTCDADGGASVIDRARGAVALRIGVGRCFQIAPIRGGTAFAVQAIQQTWVLARVPAPARPRIATVRGTVTLEGRPAARIPVLIGTSGVPLDRREGCPTGLGAHVMCVLTDARGRFAVRVRGLGSIPVAVDVDAAAVRLGRARTTGSSSVDVDLAAPPPPLRFDLRGADPEL